MAVATNHDERSPVLSLAIRTLAGDDTSPQAREIRRVLMDLHTISYWFQQQQPA